MSSDHLHPHPCSSNLHNWNPHSNDRLISHNLRELNDADEYHQALQCLSESPFWSAQQQHADDDSDPIDRSSVQDEYQLLQSEVGNAEQVIEEQHNCIPRSENELRSRTNFEAFRRYQEAIEQTRDCRRCSLQFNREDRELAQESAMENSFRESRRRAMTTSSISSRQFTVTENLIREHDGSVKSQESMQQERLCHYFNDQDSLKGSMLMSSCSHNDEGNNKSVRSSYRRLGSCSQKDNAHDRSLSLSNRHSRSNIRRLVEAEREKDRSRSTYGQHHMNRTDGNRREARNGVGGFADGFSLPEVSRRRMHRPNDDSDGNNTAVFFSENKFGLNKKTPLLSNGTERPIPFGRTNSYVPCVCSQVYGNGRKSNVPTGWLPDLPQGNGIRAWVEEVAYEASNNCDGEESVQQWVLDTFEKNPNCGSLKLPKQESWRALDLNIADEIKKMLNKAGDKFNNIKNNIALLKRKAMREKRVLGGREIIVCILSSYGQIDKKYNVNDLNNIKVPNVKSLETFYTEWKEILLDIDEEENMKELKVILENKLEESRLFEYEIRTIDLWNLPDDEVYRKYIEVIEKRIQKESKRMNDNKKKILSKNVTENTIHEQNENKIERRPPTPNINADINPPRPPYDISAQKHIPVLVKGKGKGAGKSYNIDEINQNRTAILSKYAPPNRGGIQDDIMKLCMTTNACYQYATAKCNRYDCRFNHYDKDKMIEIVEGNKSEE